MLAISDELTCGVSRKLEELALLLKSGKASAAGASARVNRLAASILIFIAEMLMSNMTNIKQPSRISELVEFCTHLYEFNKLLKAAIVCSQGLSISSPSVKLKLRAISSSLLTNRDIYSLPIAGFELNEGTISGMDAGNCPRHSRGHRRNP